MQVHLWRRFLDRQSIHVTSIWAQQIGGRFLTISKYSYDGSVFVERVISLKEPVIYVSMNYQSASLVA